MASSSGSRLFSPNLSAFESLARSDYFQSLQLAESFDNRSLATIAQLAVVRTALQPTLLNPADSNSLAEKAKKAMKMAGFNPLFSPMSSKK